jgi:hypothetical protein
MTQALIRDVRIVDAVCRACGRGLGRYELDDLGSDGELIVGELIGPTGRTRRRRWAASPPPGADLEDLIAASFVPRLEAEPRPWEVGKPASWKRGRLRWSRDATGQVASMEWRCGCGRAGRLSPRAFATLPVEMTGAGRPPLLRV